MKEPFEVIPKGASVRIKDRDFPTSFAKEVMRLVESALGTKHRAQRLPPEVANKVR